MKDKEVSPAMLGVVVIVLVILIGFGIYRFSQPANIAGPPGGYTPGVPPWMDKQHPNLSKEDTGPGAAPIPPGSRAAQALAAITPPAKYQKPPQ
jgi:hypothetical protein